MKKHPFLNALPAGVMLTALLFAALPVFAQDPVPVPVGKGSYASSIPAVKGAGKGPLLENTPPNIFPGEKRPIPTNKWWSPLMRGKGPVGLWSYPMKVETNDDGLNLYFPTQWGGTGEMFPVSESPLGVGGNGFKVDSRLVKDWSDWMMTVRMANQNNYMDVTVGEGMPCVWIEFNGVQPVLTIPQGATATYFDATGNNVDAPASGDCFGIAFSGRQYGIFAPDGTKFTVNGGSINVGFSGKSQFLAVCPLPVPKDIAYFHKYAYAIPRETRMTWNYDPAKGEVATHWKITTELLKGTEKGIVQGWIPHHYHGTVSSDLNFDGPEYPITPRGRLRCTAGNEVTITYPFNGIVPNLPAPKDTTGQNPFDPARMSAYLADVAKHPNFGAETYGGGKDILRYGQSALMAQLLNDPADQKTFVSTLHNGMANWYTYTPGEKDHFFTRYPKWTALIGINTGFGSDELNDGHFHYGYFTFATALLCAQDRQFATDYGDMATLVAKEYANWDRTDKNFPYLRNFDIWQGHSWANGFGTAKDGEDQESSSEAMQSWAGLTYLGQALGNKEMRDAGVMGYALESNGVMEYWFNYSGDVLPKEWPHAICSMVWGGKIVYGTWFSGDRAWFYGIQWLPCSPMLSYLVRDPAFAGKVYDSMVKDLQSLGKPGTLESYGANPGSSILSYLLMYDPQTVVQYLDAGPKKITGNTNEMIMDYYDAHSMITLGLVDWKCHGSSPTSMVYYNDKTKVRTFIVWNPMPQPENVTFYDGDGKVIDQLTAAPQTLSSETK